MTAGRTGGPSACPQASDTTCAVCCSVWLPLARHPPPHGAIDHQLPEVAAATTPRRQSQKGQDPQQGQHITLESHHLPFQVMNWVLQQASFRQALHVRPLSFFFLSFLTVDHALLLYSSCSQTPAYRCRILTMQTSSDGTEYCLLSQLE